MGLPAHWIDKLSELAGQEIGASGWTTIDQARIDAFATDPRVHGRHVFVPLPAPRRNP
jgi:hypothetical protein